MPVARRSDDRFTYADYLTWPDEERWELIEGEVFGMTPAPSTVHARIVLRLGHQLETVLQGHRCVPFVAPVDVVLSDDTAVQPDVLVVCDRSKIRSAGVFGAPDLIVEVLSPSTGLKDRRTKRALYERHGVREYLLVEPEARYAERFNLGPDGAYGRGELFGPDEVVTLASLGGLDLRLAEVFELPTATTEATAD
ncbi:MAG: Uma2 family endonuclease [Deltaproteobacteria bacterium]|nr:Uma2 family endonuclease [Deltaproteobacteria bacterium]